MADRAVVRAGRAQRRLRQNTRSPQGPQGRRLHSARSPAGSSARWRGRRAGATTMTQVPDRRRRQPDRGAQDQVDRCRHRQPRAGAQLPQRGEGKVLPRFGELVRDFLSM
jgi:hypothetical protein